MNDRHPSGNMTPAPASDAASAHYASYGTQEAQYGDFTTYGDYAATGFDATGHATASFATDPLFGDLPGSGHETGTYDTGHWPTGTHENPNYDAYAAQHHAAYDTGVYDTTSWTAQQQPMSVIPPQAPSPDATGQWDTGAWLQPDQSGNPADQTQQWDWGTQTFDTGAYDATQWNSDGTAVPSPDAYEQHAEKKRSTSKRPRRSSRSPTTKPPGPPTTTPPRTALSRPPANCPPSPRSWTARKRSARAPHGPPRAPVPVPAAVRPPSARRC